MRDEEIMELESKPNRTAGEDERLKALLEEQAFSQKLQKDLVPQSGTSEIESYSEEEFSNVPDRPDRDRLLKMVSQVKKLNRCVTSADFLSLTLILYF